MDSFTALTRGRTPQLDRGQWLHIFPEAKTHQSSTREVLRFRWGVSRVLMECKNDYEVIPIWLQGGCTFSSLR